MDIEVRLFADEADTIRFAGEFASHLVAPLVVYLRGELGAGKTFFTRAILTALGYQGRVKSPTFTLMEIYPLGSFTLYHLDLYRLTDPEELEYLGLRDYIDNTSIVFVEWPDKGRGWLPPEDLEISLEHQTQGRCCRVRSCTAMGDRLLRALL